MMVIAKIVSGYSQSDTTDYGAFGATNYKNPEHNSKITMNAVGFSQMQESNGSTWPTSRQAYGAQPAKNEHNQRDWPRMLNACDSGHWSTGQRFYINCDHQRQPAQEGPNFQGHFQAKYFSPSTNYSESMKIVSCTKVDETIPRPAPYRVPIDNHNYYNPITVNQINVNYNTTDAYHPANQHRSCHADHACYRYQHNTIYTHENHACNQSGAVQIGQMVASASEAQSNLSSPSLASLYHTQHGQQNYSSPVRPSSQIEANRVSFAESNKCRQHPAPAEQSNGGWVSHVQYHDYAPQLGDNKLSEAHDIIDQAGNQQARASFRVPPPYEFSDGVYEYHKPETNLGNLAYVQGSESVANFGQSYRHNSSSSCPVSMAANCPPRGANEITLVTTNNTSKMSQPLEKPDSSFAVQSSGESAAIYQSIPQNQTSVQQHQSQAEEVQLESKADLTSSSANRCQSSSDRINQCQICGRNYARPSTLKTHLRTHTNERPYKCAVCRKTFSQAANLTAHQRVHTGERPFPCPICGRQFSQSSSVITHLRTHSGERPYRCSMCNRRFSDSSTLTKHCRIHSGEKPYQCDYCPMNFSQSGNLSRHLRLHLTGGLNKTTSAPTSAPISSGPINRNDGPKKVIATSLGSSEDQIEAAAARLRRLSTDLSNSSPELTLSPPI